MRAAVEELGYRPNRQARSLRTARTHVLGLVLPTLALPVMPDIIQGAAAAAHEHGYLLTISDAHDDPELWTAYIDELIARQVDGLLCYQFGATENILRPAQEAGVPTILLQRSRPHPVAPSLAVDEQQAFDEAFADLRSHGHQRIAMITPSTRSHRFDLLREALSGAGLSQQEDLERVSDTPEAARAAVDALMALDQPPTAIFVHWVTNAEAVADQLEARGFDIPGDISIIGFGVWHSRPIARPTFSVVLSAPLEDARAAVELLVRHIEGDETAPRTLIRTSKYKPGDTVGPARVRS